MPVSPDELESHLFKCADIIRDAVDSTDYKEYILPLVYYKSISDEFEKQYEENVEEYGEDFARRENLYDIPVVPKGNMWDDLRAVSDNVDEALNKSFEALIEANVDSSVELEGVFRADYIDADALDDDRLGRLIEHLSKYDLDRDSVPPDMLGEAYMDLVRDFAEEEGKEGGQFFTPPRIVNLCVRLVNEFEDGHTFHDPTVGSGGMLIEAARYYREEQNGDPRKLEFTGQEINPDIAAIAKMNLSIHGLNGQTEREDSLSSPQFTNESDNTLERFNRVLANFPFSYDWAKDELQDDPYNRFDWHEKLPRADRGDYAFIMHMAKQLKTPEKDGEGGKAAIVIPHGVLFRKHEQRYRKAMLENNMVEAIVGLPENLFQNVGIPSAILVLNTDKPVDREGEVQFIHAADEDFYDELSNQNRLTEDGLNHIVRNLRDWTTEERVSRTVRMDEIRGNEYNLNIALYVDTTEPQEDIDVREELPKLRTLQKERDEIESQIIQHMEALGVSNDATLSKSTKDIIGNNSNQATQYQQLPEVDNLPSDWSLVTVEDVSNEIVGGGTPSKDNEEYWNGEIPWASVKDLGGIRLSETGDSISKEGLKNSATNLIPADSIVISTRMTVGEPFLNGVDMAINQDMKAIIPDTGMTNSLFVVYSLWDKDPYLKSLGRGTTVDGITTRDLATTHIGLPPLAEQRKITTILHTIDKAIRKTEEIIRRSNEYNSSYKGRLQRLKEGLMQDLISGKVRTTDADIDIPEEVAKYG